MESYIMKLISVASEPGMISFATGLPDKRLFDVEGLRDAAEDVLNGGSARSALQYGITEGLPSLRKKIAERCGKELHAKVSPENVFVTNGSQECFDHIGKLFLDPGDPVIVENPGYLGALQSYSVYSPKFIGIDMNENGPDIAQVADALKSRPKLYYAVPNHQNPSGISYSDDARSEIAELFADADTVIAEDDAYGELGFSGKRKKCIRSMNGNVILTGSYSKIISPGMRIGWMIVPDELIDNVRVSMEASCLHANMFSQAVMDRFLEKNDLSGYLKPIRAEYKRKCDLMLDLLDDAGLNGAEWNRPDGGMFIWMRTPEGTDAMKLFNAALERKLVIMPGRPFHVRGGSNTIRLNFATSPDEEIKKGTEILAKAYADAM